MITEIDKQIALAMTKEIVKNRSLPGTFYSDYKDGDKEPEYWVKIYKECLHLIKQDD